MFAARLHYFSKNVFHNIVIIEITIQKQFRNWTVFVKTGFCIAFEVNVQLRLSPLGCAVDHAAAFAVNALLVASQWRHRTWTVSSHPPINSEHEDKQAAARILRFKFSVQPDQELNSPSRLWWFVLNQLYYIAVLWKHFTNNLICTTNTLELNVIASFLKTHVALLMILHETGYETSKLGLFILWFYSVISNRLCMS